MNSDALDDVIGSLSAVMVEDRDVTRVVIDAEIGKVVKIYVKRISDEQLLDVEVKT